MKKLAIRSLTAIVFLSLHCYGQNNVQESEELKAIPQALRNSGKRPLEINEQRTTEKESILFRYSMDFLHPQRNLKEEQEFNVVKSFRSNIRFGGFWDKYVIVNYTPEMNIQPTKSISIFAQHNLSYFIPITGLKEHFRMMAIQSAAILAIDNSVKLLVPVKGMLNSIVNFALKNAVLHYMLKSVTSNGNEKIFEFGYYYYSISVRF